MNNRTERQFQEADAALEGAVITFKREIKPTLGKWEAVAPAYIVERLMLALCTEMSKLVDESKIDGEATLRLSNALADYRDTRWEEHSLRHQNTIQRWSALAKAALTAPKSNFRFTPESGLNSDIAPCPKSADTVCKSLFAACDSNS
jgi:hypothetical protein